MIKAALQSIDQLFSAKFRGVLFKSLGLTLVAFVLLWMSAETLITKFLVLPFDWMETIVAVLAGFGIFAGMIFFLLPITSLVATFFIDEIADAVEEKHFPHDKPGKEMPVLQGLIIAIKYTFSILCINILVLFLAIIPGINLLVFYGGNGYLLGREYFTLCGLRYLPHKEVVKLRRKNRTRVWLSGVIIAFVATIPFVNLLTPLFATAFMVHTFKAVSRKDYPDTSELSLNSGK